MRLFVAVGKGFFKLGDSFLLDTRNVGTTDAKLLRNFTLGAAGTSVQTEALYDHRLLAFAEQSRMAL